MPTTDTSPASAPATDSTEVGEGAVAQRFTEALLELEREGQARLDAMTALFAGNARFTSPALRQAGAERSGTGGARTFWSEYLTALAGASTEFHRVTLGERSVGLFWTTRGERAESRAAFSYDGSTLLELDTEGRIERFSAYFDPRELAPL